MASETRNSSPMLRAMCPWPVRSSATRTTPGGLVIVREGWGRTAVQGDGSVPQVVDHRGKLLRGQILEVGFPVSTGIDADDLHQAYSFMTTVFLGRGTTPCV